MKNVLFRYKLDLRITGDLCNTYSLYTLWTVRGGPTCNCRGKSGVSVQVTQKSCSFVVSQRILLLYRHL